MVWQKCSYCYGKVGGCAHCSYNGGKDVDEAPKSSRSPSSSFGKRQPSPPNHPNNSGGSGMATVKGIIGLAVIVGVIGIFHDNKDSILPSSSPNTPTNTKPKIEKVHTIENERKEILIKEDKHSRGNLFKTYSDRLNADIELYDKLLLKNRSSGRPSVSAPSLPEWPSKMSENYKSLNKTGSSDYSGYGYWIIGDKSETGTEKWYAGEWKNGSLKEGIIVWFDEKKRASIIKLGEFNDLEELNGKGLICSFGRAEESSIYFQDEISVKSGRFVNGNLKHGEEYSTSIVFNSKNRESINTKKNINSNTYVDYTNYSEKDKMSFSGKGYYNDGKKVYQGDVKNGEFHGDGTYTLKYKNDSLVYKGEFKEGEWHGYGEVITTYGIRYEGEFKEDKMDGYGIFTDSKKGFTHEGEFEDGKMHGYGTRKEGGISQNGYWENDKYVGRIK